jgi:hypothetical protein
MTTETSSRAERVSEILKKLESGIRDLFSGEKFGEYLKTMSQFYNYSANNTILIYQQFPKATAVAGFKTWKEKFGRTVKKGERGIKILAPLPCIDKKEFQKLDPDTKEPLYDKDGSPLMEELMSIRAMRYKTVTIFDQSQTEGKPLPTLASELIGSVDKFDVFMQALQAISPLPIRFEQMSAEQDGYCQYDSHIAIREGMSEIQTVLAAIHEISHSRLHNKHKENEKNSLEKKPKSKAFQEIEAEACAYSTANFFGIETSENSFGYIANYTAKADIKELKQLLSGIQNATAEMISGIETAFKDIAKQRGVDVSIRENAEEISAKTDELPKEIETPQISTIAFINPEVANHTTFNDRKIGETVLMPMLFNDDGNLERTAKRTRVKIEEPVGKYQIYSRLDGTPPYETEYAYLLSQSGKLVHLGEMEKAKEISEIKIDEWIAKSLQMFDKHLENPSEWADYVGAALADKIDIAETHNVPVKAAREAKIQAERTARIEQSKAEKQEREAAFTEQIDRIETAIHNCEKCDVELDHYTDKNPLFAVFERHGVNLPLATKGWVNRNLKEFHLDEKGSLTV